MKIDWHIGSHNWAFEVNNRHITACLPGYEHTYNKKRGDVRVLITLEQMMAYEPETGLGIAKLDTGRMI